MSREIEFRVYDKTAGYYVAVLGNDCFGIKQVARIILELDTLKHEYIVEQFTGLLDRNGKEICEGDIVRFGSSVATIIWRDKEAEFGVKWIDCGIEDCISWQIGVEKTPCEVIGNIHENPELVEAK